MSCFYKDDPESVKTFRNLRDRHAGNPTSRRNRLKSLSAAPPFAEASSSGLGAHPSPYTDARKHAASRGGGALSPASGRAGPPSTGEQSSNTTSSSEAAGRAHAGGGTDVLSRGCFQMQGLGFHQLTVSNAISPEMLGLNGLIDSVYLKLTATGTYFSKHVPKSVFSYYCCVFSYARLLRLAHDSGTPLTNDEQSFVDFVDGSGFVMPEPLRLYLAAFGKTSLSSGTKLRFRLAPREYCSADNIPGFFGRVGAQTHYLYAAYPCLAVCACRILADLSRTADGVAQWDLPQAIRPLPREGIRFGYPTENMVGYGLAAHLKTSQRTWLENLGVFGGDRPMFPSLNNTLPINAQLLEAVSYSLAECRAYTLTPLAGAEVEGSQVQATRVRIDSHMVVPALSPYLKCNVSVQSPDQYDVAHAVAGLIFCFRAYRGTSYIANGSEVHNWCVYDCGNYLHVPVDWRATANEIGASDNPYLDLMMFETNDVSRTRYMQTWSEKLATSVAKATSSASLEKR